MGKPVASYKSRVACKQADGWMNTRKWGRVCAGSGELAAVAPYVWTDGYALKCECMLQTIRFLGVCNRNCAKE